MGFPCNLHTHTSYSDGKHTPEEMVLAAIEKGFATLGFSEHSPLTMDECAMPAEKLEEYIGEINRLKEKYAGQIELYLGMENDFWGPCRSDALDYTIGSVHFIRDERTGRCHVFDYRRDWFETAVREIGGGDVRKLVESYYALVDRMLRECPADILGHVDLIAKLNEGDRYFGEGEHWYQELTAYIADRIQETGCIVELNTGGIARGYRTVPYPAPPFLKLLTERGIPITITSDAHEASTLDYWFPQAEELLRSVGYRSAKILRGGVFVDYIL